MRIQVKPNTSKDALRPKMELEKLKLDKNTVSSELEVLNGQLSEKKAQFASYSSENEVMKAAGVRYGDETLEKHKKLDSIKKLVIVEEEKLNAVLKGRSKAEGDIERYAKELEYLKEKNKKIIGALEEDTLKMRNREENILNDIASRKDGLQQINDGIIEEKNKLTQLVREREAYLDNIEVRRANAEGVLKELLKSKENELNEIMRLKEKKDQEKLESEAVSVLLETGKEELKVLRERLDKYNREIESQKGELLKVVTKEKRLEEATKKVKDLYARAGLEVNI